MGQKSQKYIHEHIFDLKEFISSDMAKKALKQDILIRTHQKNLDIAQIKKHIAILKKRRDKLFPYLKLLKNNIPDILDETFESACYLINAQIFKLWDTIFILGEQGNNVSLMVIIRAIKEYNMLLNFFALECKDDKKDNELKKWFNGHLIMHGDGREKIKSLMKDDDAFNETDADNHKNLGTHVYKIESALAHPSYVSVLENIDPFTKDYDFELFVGINRCVSALEYAYGTLNNTILAMSAVFGFVFDDLNSYKELNTLFDEYHPNDLSPDQVLKIIRS
ncbi:MAG: hypothetical protein COX80_01410 [Candidatus Magasanikbacteria bacterium CG_4_10_14_0_2_um_filter_33_14]|uniref:Uncharacterized protein n=1 Tax=Candidatus Magasanikbacteria bacterium CG_4_10_14_0_2_um_filter_33_14 TaxID=1974636 RepID=A0A2M7VBH1_9BACT|nr:MAG: hypothetical protein COX80_01410 [Candidatus Magasanikbacteria bacterium CG_4_10_14_0_2_um_filter_33_14]